MMLRGSPVVVTIFDATADTPNAIEPARLSAAMRHEMLRSRHDHQPWLTSNQASPLATRKQIDPTMSGTHTRRCACVASRLASSAASVVTLKNTVPTSCTALADQSMRRRLPRPEAEALVRDRRRERVGRVQGLQVLQVRGRREEDRTDEEGDGIGVGPDPTDVAGERPDGEAQGADGEQRADPPADRGGRPPRGAAAGVEATGLLPVLAGRPLDHLAVGRAEALARDERTEPHGVGARPARGRRDVGARQERQPTTVVVVAPSPGWGEERRGSVVLSTS